MIRKYQIKDRQYEDIFKLAEDIQLYPRDFYRAFYKNQELLNFIKAQDFKKYQQILPLIDDHTLLQDVLLYKITYILNPYLPLIYHGYRFKDYRSIALRIIYFAPKVDVYLLDLLKEGLLLDHMRLNQLHDRDKELYRKIEEYTKLAKNEPNLAYFRLGFYLYGTKDFYYDGIKYRDLKELLSSLLSATTLIYFAKDFEESCFLPALQIEDAKSTAIYDRYQHVVSLYEDKERHFKREVAIKEKQEKRFNSTKS